jgi:hypothetical protein
VQTGRLNRDSTVGTCGTSKPCPSIFDGDARHYDAYTVTNTNSTSACFTVSLDAGSCVDTQYLFSAAYLGSFDPGNVCANYLADLGASPNPRGSYSFSVPAGATFVVVVHEVDPDAGCGAYRLSVTNCPGPDTCLIEFADVPPDHTFYPFVKCLACRDILSGYPDGTFRPNNYVTRGQLAKIVANSAGFQEPVSGQTFEDVAPGSTFYEFIERLASREVMSGYPCGIDPAEPCSPANLPYFRPFAGATRGQLTKIVSNAAGFNNAIPPSQYGFTDVAPGSTFWLYVERLLTNRPDVMAGYPCGVDPAEPCDSENRAYFRPNNPLTRGQTAKIVSNTFFPECGPTEGAVDVK